MLSSPQPSFNFLEYNWEQPVMGMSGIVVLFVKNLSLDVPVPEEAPVTNYRQHVTQTWWLYFVFLFSELSSHVSVST